MKLNRNGIGSEMRSKGASRASIKLYPRALKSLLMPANSNFIFLYIQREMVATGNGIQFKNGSGWKWNRIETNWSLVNWKKVLMATIWF